MKERRGKTGMKIEKFVTGIISTNCYLVINEETKHAVIVDLAAFPRALKNYIEEEEYYGGSNSADTCTF